MGFFLVALVVVGLVAILQRPPIAKAWRGLLGDRKELLLFAVFEVVAIAAWVLVLMAFGLKAGIYVLLGGVSLFALWATKPPAKPR